MLNDDFFVPEVEFQRRVSQRRERTAPQRLVLTLGRWGLAAATVITIYPTTVSDVRIVPSVLERSHPSAELSPDIVALYRDAALEDRELAETGISDYQVLVGSSDET